MGIGKVLSMVSELEGKIIGEGEVVQKEYAEFSEWCEDRSRNIGFEIKTGKSGVDELTAAIAEETSTIGSLEAKVEELAAGISTDETLLSTRWSDSSGTWPTRSARPCSPSSHRTDEEMAVAEYEKETKENEIEKTTKSQDVKYKAKESKELDKY